jgi:hypothetical protein
MEDNNELIIIENEKGSVLEQIKDIQITNDDENKNAGEFLKQIKTASKNIETYWKPLKESAKKAHSDLCEKEKQMLNPLKEAEIQIKAKMSVYILEQEKKAREKEEAIRKAQQEEALRQLAEAEKLRAEGNETEAQVVEEIAFATDETKTIVKPETQKQEGISYQIDYKITVTDNLKVPTFLNGIEIRPVDLSAIKRIVKMQKGQVQIEGIKIEEEKIVKVRS